jgi:hypothetical protein
MHIFAASKEFWVHGSLPDESLHKAYISGLGKIVDYYSRSFDLEITLISEAEAISKNLDKVETPVVICGPVQGFKNLDFWQIPEFSVKNHKVKIGKLDLVQPNTGIFLKSPNEKRSIYTGLSLNGYDSIFTVPTGQKPLTIVVNGQKKWYGDYENAALKITRESFRPRVPEKNELEIDQKILELIDGEGFNEKTDLNWLISHMKDKKVLFIGETHWSVEVPQIRNKIMFDLAGKLPIEGIMLELPFSVSAFYQHYIDLADDKEAAKFLKTTLDIMISEESTMELLEMLRIWNRKNPAKRLKIGTIDMEWNSLVRFKTVFAPILARYGKNDAVEKFYKAVETGNNSEMIGILEDLLNNVAPQSKAFSPEEYGGARISEAWLKNIIKNYIDTLRISAGASFDQTRQKAIIRNLTDMYGKWFKQGKVIIHGGSWHGFKHPPRNEKETWLDAAYLENVFPETKGRVSNLYIGVIGHSFARVTGVTFDKFIPVADLLKQLIYDFNSSLKDGSAGSDQFYTLFDPLSTMELVAIALADKLGTNILRIKKVDWKKMNQLVPGCSETKLGANLTGYDHALIVLRGTIDKPRRIPLH